MLSAILAPIHFIQPAQPPAAFDLDSLGFADMRQFHGRPVVALFTAATPLYTWRTGRDLVTVAGPGKDDGAEWSVMLKGNRLNDVREGDRLRVRGVLKVIDHPPAVVDGKLMPGWTEVRMVER